MKNKTGIVVYLVLCSLIIGGAIYGGKKQHSNCRECKLAMGINAPESSKFASWK